MVLPMQEVKQKPRLPQGQMPTAAVGQGDNLGSKKARLHPDTPHDARTIQLD